MGPLQHGHCWPCVEVWLFASLLGKELQVSSEWICHLLAGKPTKSNLDREVKALCAPFASFADVLLSSLAHTGCRDIMTTSFSPRNSAKLSPQWGPSHHVSYRSRSSPAPCSSQNFLLLLISAEWNTDHIWSVLLDTQLSHQPPWREQTRPQTTDCW